MASHSSSGEVIYCAVRIAVLGDDARISSSISPCTYLLQLHLTGIAPSQARVRELEGVLTPRERCTILWSYGKLRCYPGEQLLDRLLAAPAANLSRYEPVVHPGHMLHLS